MKRRWMYVILATFFAIFFLYSCVSPTTTNSKEVTITIDRLGVYRNATLILAQDGLNGDWKELTGTNGIYKFNVNDPDGVYSVAAVDDIPHSDYKDIQLFHSTLAEGKTIDIKFSADYETDFLTLTINFPATYEKSQAGIFFLSNHSFPMIEQASVTTEILKGKGDLVVFIEPDWNSEDEIDEFQKVYIKRDFEINDDKVITISESDLKAPGSFITADDTTVSYSWIINNTIVPSFSLRSKRIPSMATNDRYLARYGNWIENTRFVWSKVTKDVPVTVSNEIKNFVPPTSPIITATETDTDGLPKITFTPYESTISDYRTKYYEFELYKKETLEEYTYLTQTHSIFITPGYLAKVENVYKFPNITLTAWKDAYKPVTDYVVQSLGICLSPNTIDEINSLKIGTEVLGLYSKF